MCCRHSKHLTQQVEVVCYEFCPINFSVTLKYVLPPKPLPGVFNLLLVCFILFSRNKDMPENMYVKSQSSCLGVEFLNPQVKSAIPIDLLFSPSHYLTLNL